MSTSTSTPTATSSPRALPRRSALKDDSDRTPPLSGLNKAVHIAEPETASADESPHRKQFSAGLSRRLSGRAAVPPSNSSRASLISQTSFDGGASSTGLTASPAQVPEDSKHSHHLHPSPHHRHRADVISEKLLAQVAEWVGHEKAKREARKARRVHRHLRKKSKSPPAAGASPDGATDGDTTPVQDGLEIRHKRSTSVDSQSSEVSLDRLQRIIEDNMAALGLESISQSPGKFARRQSSHHKLRRNSSYQLNRAASSDTDYVDGDVLVPSCNAVLDNSKTMSYSGGKAAASASPDAGSVSSRREEKEKQAWAGFKNEIIRLAHTLRLKGWRRVPLDGGGSITVERLSGALTNAVYVVTPPAELMRAPSGGKRRPTKLLLRVYGPQVEQLIDRENELSVLRRLARKKIGPRLLGTFTNGRFEQFFNATTLTPANLREPETSKQIAKRMRELHDGVELLEEELDEGPAVWKNWDRWLDTVERTMTYLDGKMLAGEVSSIRGAGKAWKSRGFICGVEWPKFRAMVERYRDFLDRYYGGNRAIRDKLVFAHNDTQYGNILRVRPDDEKSPLLQPANEHKQLIVIDFEYAAANTPGLEFANHFTEWTYNYHDPVAPWACNTAMYPTPEQQRRFIKAYVEHRPQFPLAGGGASTPRLTPQLQPPSQSNPPTPQLQTASSSSSIVDFMLDARVPPGGWKEEEKRREEQTERRVKELMEETRLWRIANSAQWVAWGIVQAKVAATERREVVASAAATAAADAADALADGGASGSMANGGGEGEGRRGGRGVPSAPAAVTSEEEDDAVEFDYLAYSQDRALFFWGDCVLMGLVAKEELPDELRARIKLVEY